MADVIPMPARPPGDREPPDGGAEIIAFPEADDARADAAARFEAVLVALGWDDLTEDETARLYDGLTTLWLINAITAELHELEHVLTFGHRPAPVEDHYGAF